MRPSRSWIPTVAAADEREGGSDGESVAAGGEIRRQRQEVSELVDPRLGRRRWRRARAMRLRNVFD
ncbi:Fe2OG dioxygenase domain-containing protein [Psidium guajava]|nr:Fe2OG dioxygenase domain-containing protein [Psidium guajava]